MRVNDMTQGDPVRLILAFAIPLFIGNIFQQVYSMVDTMVAGYNLGDDAIAAIGATSSLYSLIINLASGMNSGFAIVVTQSFGAHDEKKLRQSIAGTLLLNALIAAVLTALSLMFLRPLLHFMNTPEAIFEDAYSYIFMICAGMVATVCYNLFAGILRAVGNSRTPLYFLILSSLLNIALDVLFVAGFHLGIAGAAWATVIAQTISATLCGLYVARHYGAILPTREDIPLPPSILWELFSAGFAMALMYCVVDIGSVIFQRANNHLGKTVISAHTAARRLIVVFMQPLGTIATASSTFVGQNWGAKQTQRIRSTLKKVMGMELAWSVFACALVFLLGRLLVRLTTGTSDPFILENAVLSLRLHLAFFPALGILVCLRTAMQAMGRKVAPVLSSCLELGMKFFSAAWLIPKFGFLGTCVTEPFTWVIMFLFLGIVYLCQRKTLFPEVETQPTLP